MSLSARERELYQRLLDAGRLDPASVKRAIEVRERLRREGGDHDLARVLVEQGILPAEEVESYLARSEPVQAWAGVPMGDEDALSGVWTRDLAPGRDLGRYRIHTEISRGGMGAVYLAEQRPLDRSVALKILLRRDDRERFLREGKLLARLNHPNIPRVYDFGFLRDAAYCAMEYVDGKDLGQLVESRALGVRDAVRIVATVARALAHAHESGILHRDVKAENIVVDAKGAPYLIDFGLAAPLPGSDLDVERLTRTNQVLGSLRYMSPEHLTGRIDRLDERTDLFALGVTLHYATTGVFPFPAGSLRELAQLFRSGHTPDPARIDPRIPGPLARAILRALALDPAARPESAVAMAEELERALAAPDSARVTSARVRATRGRRRGRFPRAVLLAAAALFVLVFGGASVVLLLGSRDGEDPGRGPGAEEESALAAAREHHRLGKERDRAGDDVRVVDEYRRAAELAPDVAEFRESYGLSLLYIAQDFESALREFDATLSLDPNIVGALRGRGLARAKLGDLAGAIEDYSRALRLEPENSSTFHNRGAIRMQQGNLAAALADLDAAIRLDGSDPDSWSVRGAIHLELGNPRSALADLDRAVDLDPADAAIFARRGNAHLALSESDRALEDFRMAVELDTNCAAAHFGLAQIAIERRDYAGAMPYLDRTTELQPDTSDVLTLRGHALRQLGRLDESLNDLTRAITLDGRNARAFAYRGDLYGARGDLDAALRDYERAIQLDPELGLGYVGRGEMRRLSDDLARALEDFRLATRFDATGWRGWYGLGMCLGETGERQGAVDAMEEAIRLAPPDMVPTLQELADRYRRGD